MKIGFVLDDSLDKADGVQQYILTMGHWLRSNGHEVHYLVGETHRRDVPNVHSLARNLKVAFNGNNMSTPLPVAKAKLKRLLEKEKFDVLHIQVPYSPWLAGRLIKLAPKSTAIVGTFHILPYTWFQQLATRFLRLILFRSLRRFDAWMAVSKPATDFARRSLGIKAKTVPNMIDVNHFSSEPLKKYQDGKLMIVFLGRLVPRKGCQQLLEALSLLHRKQQLQRIRVLICGQGPEKIALEQFVRKHNLRHIVYFTGFVTESDKPRYLASADIAIFPSIAGESFGIVLLEAMAAGAGVVIGGDNPGYRSVLEGRNDQLVPVKDIAKLAHKLQHFINSGRARRQAHNWQERTIRKYDVHIVGQQIIDVYRQALQRRTSVR